MVSQPVNFVVADELAAVDVFLVPAGAVHHDVERTRVIGRLHGPRHAGPQLALVLHQPQHALQRLVVQIRRPAELRIVRVRGKYFVLLEQISIRMNQAPCRRTPSARLVQFLGLGGRDVRDLRHRVLVLAVRLAALNVFQPRQQRGAIAVEVAVQIVTPQKLHRPRRRFWSAGRQQVERAGQRIARRVADLDPFGRCGTADDACRGEPQHQRARAPAAQGIEFSAHFHAHIRAHRWFGALGDWAHSTVGN